MKGKSESKMWRDQQLGMSLNGHRSTGSLADSLGYRPPAIVFGSSTQNDVPIFRKKSTS
jgi:hypothetical protein